MPNYSVVHAVTENPQDHVAVSTALVFAKHAKTVGRKMHGTNSFEGFQDTPPSAMSMAAYPNGDMFVWFMDMGVLFMVCLVNETLKMVKAMPINEAREFMQFVNATANQINMKNGFPIEQADDFLSEDVQKIMQDNRA